MNCINLHIYLEKITEQRKKMFCCCCILKSCSWIVCFMKYLRTHAVSTILKKKLCCFVLTAYNNKNVSYPSWNDINISRIFPFGLLTGVVVVAGRAAWSFLVPGSNTGTSISWVGQTNNTKFYRIKKSIEIKQLNIRPRKLFSKELKSIETGNRQRVYHLILFPHVIAPNQNFIIFQKCTRS